MLDIENEIASFVGVAACEVISCECNNQNNQKID